MVFFSKHLSSKITSPHEKVSIPALIQTKAAGRERGAHRPLAPRAATKAKRQRPQSKGPAPPAACRRPSAEGPARRSTPPWHPAPARPPRSTPRLPCCPCRLARGSPRIVRRPMAARGVPAMPTTSKTCQHIGMSIPKTISMAYALEGVGICQGGKPGDSVHMGPFAALLPRMCSHRRGDTLHSN